MTISASNLLHYPFIIAFSQARQRSKAAKTSAAAGWQSPLESTLDGDEIAAQAMRDDALLAKEECTESASDDEDEDGSDEEGGEVEDEDAVPGEAVADRQWRLANTVKQGGLHGAFTEPTDFSGDEDSSKAAAATLSRDRERRKRLKGRHDDERLAEAAGEEGKKGAQSSGAEKVAQGEDAVALAADVPSVDEAGTHTGKAQRDYELNEGEQLVLQVRLVHTHAATP